VSSVSAAGSATSSADLACSILDLGPTNPVFVPIRLDKAAERVVFGSAAKRVAFGSAAVAGLSQLEFKGLI